MTLTMCGTIINSVMAISNPKIGSCSIPRYPKLQAQEPLLEACSVFAPGVATIVTSGSKHTMSIQCDTDTSPPWNHLVRDAQDVSELGFPFFNMTSYTCGARLPCRWWSLDMPHTYFCGQVQIPPQKPDLEDLAVCLWHTGKNCFHGCTVRFFVTNSFLTLSEVFSIWNQWHLRCSCASMQAIIKTKKSTWGFARLKYSNPECEPKIADESGIQSFLRILPNGWTYDWVRIHGSL